MAITQTDINLILQHDRKTRIRIDILNTDDEKIGEITGLTKSLSGAISASSDIRRTLNLTMHVSDRSFLAESHTLIWLNRKIQVNIGLIDMAGVTHWYLLGSYLIADTSYVYDATTQDLTLPLLDMMACTTQQRGSQIGGYGLKINAGTNARESLISTITSFTPYHQHNIVELPDVIPYDLEFSVGVYPYEVLKTILSLFPTYEMFYSPEGVFTVSQIPTGIEDDIFVDDTVIDNLIVSESKTLSFSNIRNTTEIQGRSLDADYTASTCALSGDTYNVFIDDAFEVLEDGALYGMTPAANSVSGQKIKIQDTTAYGIYYQGATQEDDTPIPVGEMVAGVHYCIKYTNYRFYLQGELEIRVIVQEVTTLPSTEAQAAFKTANDCRVVEWIVNPNSPFAADVVGEIRQVLSDGEYANIYTTPLALERARYENWKTTRLQNSCDISLHFIPWLDVNKKISYHSPLLGKLCSDDIYINDDGLLVMAGSSSSQPYLLEVIDGQLVYTPNEDYDGYINTTFYIDDDGNLVMDSSNGAMTWIIQEINFDLNGFRTNIKATQFYPYYPFGQS